MPSPSLGQGSRRNAEATRPVWPWWLLLGALSACAAPPPAPPVWIEVREGESIEALAESLEAHAIVGHAQWFARFARIGNRHLDIKPGYYPLSPHTMMAKVLETLRSGRPPGRRLVIRPRMTLAEVASELHAALGVPRDSILGAARDSALRALIGTSDETVEGYLFPTTYYMNLDATPVEMLRQMTDTFAARWDRRWNARLDTVGLSRDEIVTLASIIEGEMPHDDDRFAIASVYHNRLARGMRLQADPTVVYALGRRRRLTFNDYDIASDYNTYTINGLPPGPIGQPSSASIEAALYPAETDYLYFVGRSDGRHLFSQTYGDHLRTIRTLRGR